MESDLAPSLLHLTEPTSPSDREQDGEDSSSGSDDSFNDYDAMASEYANSPGEIARGAWMKELVKEHKDWIGFGQMGANIKALDYCAGTGFFSQALAPYVHEILAVDSARNMTIEYNKMAEETKAANPRCDMRAVWGDLIDGEEPADATWEPNAEFDLIAMSLAVNFFACACCGVPGLQSTLQLLTSRLKPNGTMLILDIQKDYATAETLDSEADEQKPRNGRKIKGFGSVDVTMALEGLGMEDVMVAEGIEHCFRFENVVDGEPVVTDEAYYLLKAKKGSAYHDDIDDAIELQASE